MKSTWNINLDFSISILHVNRNYRHNHWISANINPLMVRVVDGHERIKMSHWPRNQSKLHSYRLLDGYGLARIQTANVLGLNRLFILVLHFQTKPTEHYCWCVAFITKALPSPWTLFALLFYIYEKMWAIIKMRHTERCMLDFLNYWGSATRSYFRQKENNIRRA